jgi:methylated-DNA-[protein]-cysteine S-methyltransferase
MSATLPEPPPLTRPSATPARHAAQGYDAVLRLGPLHVGLRARAGALTRLDFVPEQPEYAPAESWVKRVRSAFERYLGDPRAHPRMDLDLGGTVFQERVWATLLATPPGETRRYGDIAAELGSSARAVGGACRANPVALFIPCHRVVAARGLGGFDGRISGDKLDVKRWLLGHEGAL